VTMQTALVLLLAVVSPALSVFRLEPGAFLQLPDHLDRTVYNNGAANKVAYDPQENFLYVIGYRADVLHVVDMSDPANPSRLVTKHFNIPMHGLPDAIAVCRSETRPYLVVSHESPDQIEKAHIHIYRLLTPSTINNNLERIRDMAVLDAFDPKSMAWAPGFCDQILVVSEGEPHEVNGAFVDPNGDVEILTMGFGTTIGKTSVPIIESDLEGAGVRRVFTQCDSTANNNTMPPPSSRRQDLGPKAVTIDQNGMAYIAFQDNNAIAKYDLMDLSADRKMHYFDLGTKDWGLAALDGSYDDQAIALEERPGLKGLYQPSALVTFELDGKTWLATADQGSIRAYNFATCRYDVSVTARSWNQDFSGALSEADRIKLNADMNSNQEIGRLRVSKLKIPNDGWNNLMEAYDYVTAFGGRGFSIYDADDMTRVYDSGDSMERYFVSGSATPAQDVMFNAKVGSAGTVQSSQKDRASPEMGPAPSDIIVADWSNSTKVLVISNGVSGGLYVYSVNSGPVVNFESYVRRGNPGLTYIEDQGQRTVVAVSSTAASLSFYTLVEDP
ncbi:hypothetical protein BaRGS_00017367, partial [Batillaria attramentaria]